MRNRVVEKNAEAQTSHLQVVLCGATLNGKLFVWTVNVSQSTTISITRLVYAYHVMKKVDNLIWRVHPVVRNQAS